MRGKKPKEGAWGKLRSWFPQFQPTDLAEEPFFRVGFGAGPCTGTVGINLCAGNIALKAAPQGKAIAYLAANALVTGVAATVAPILAGLAAGWFAKQELALALRWTSAETAETIFDLSALSLKGLDFLFVIAVLFGVYAMHRLLAVREEGEVEEKVVLSQLYSEVRKAVRHVSNVAGLRQQYYFPYAKLEDVAHKSESAHTNEGKDST